MKSNRLVCSSLCVLTAICASARSAPPTPVTLSSMSTAGEVQVRPADPLNVVNPLRAETFASLEAAARTKGRVNVIVHVSVDRVSALTATSISTRTVPLAVQADARLAGAIDSGVKREMAKLAGTAYTLGRTYKSIPFASMRVSEAALKRLEASPGVLGIEEDRLAKMSLNNTVNIVGATAAFAGGFDGTGWSVAILDVGVLSAHEFFAGKTIEQACFAQGPNGPGGAGDCPNGTDVDLTPGSSEPYSSIWPGYDHGTHVAGIAVGNGPSVPASGIARGADLIAIKVFSKFVGGCQGSDCLLAITSDQIAAQDYVFGLRLTHHIAAVSLSLGGGAFNNQAICDAANAAQKASIDVLRAAGIATVIAGGNDGSCTDIEAPGCISSAIAVGASTDADVEAGFNNWHPTLLDIFAPGVNILSSEAFSTSGYGNMSGTSMATPHVSGAFAILKQADPGASVTEIFNALDQSGQPINGLCGQPVPQRRIQIDDAITLLGFDACCQGGGVCTDTTAAGCAALGGKFRPGHSCGDLPSPCDEDVKFSQVPDGTGESLVSDLDWTVPALNVTVADDFTSDGRPLRSVRWWGSELGPPLDEYLLDDGISETGIGLTGGGDVIWINQFTVLPGLETINSVSVAWSAVADGTAATILIYDDPNNDGDPTDAVLLTTQATTVTNANTDTFNRIVVTPTVVGVAGDSFFVGAFITHATNEFPAAIDQTVSAGRSWIAGGGVGTGDINNLANNGLPVAVIDSLDPTLAGNWLVRADAGTPQTGSPDGWFLSFHQPLVGFGPALGLYYCDQSIVSATPTVISSCDGKSVQAYRADLVDCCLVHANPDTRSGAVPAAADGFFEERCVDYLMGVQAVIGHRFDNVGGVCTEVATGRTASSDFWGWHTAPPTGVPFGLTSATTFLLLNDLDWPYEPAAPASATCSTPDMAFQLITDEILNGDPDANGDGYPDSCECTVINGAVADPAAVLQNRYLPFSVLPPAGVGSKQAIQVELINLTPFPAFSSQKRWVGPPQSFPDGDSANPGRTFVAAGLSCTPHFADWSSVGLLQVFGAEVMPQSMYAVRVFDDCCSDLNDPSCFSSPLPISTGRFGDVIDPFFTNPGDVEPSFQDISALVSSFLDDAGSLRKASAQLQPNVVFPQNPINFKDINAVVRAFLSDGYADLLFATGPCTCPSAVICGATACVTDGQCGGGFCIGGFCTDACGRCAP